jgi:hypothetical protein
MPNVVTANLLASGDVVYLGRDGLWVREIAEAEVATDKPQLTALEDAANRSIADQTVTSVYAMDVGLDNGCPIPLSVREKIRAQHGPTV